MNDESKVAKNEALVQLRRIADILERIERQQDEYFAVDLSARYPFGKPTDRWARPRRGVA
jgi:hypothetical protein